MPRALKPSLIFYPGKAGGAFIKQYQQAGLRETMPLYSVFTVDGVSLPKFQEAGMDGVLGTFNTMYWSPDLPNAQNRTFVESYVAAYGDEPAHYAAQAYDLIFMIKAAVEAVDGNLDDMDGIRAALASANYPSTRGEYSYGANHMPVQNFYLREVVVGDDGRWTNKIVATVYENHQDPYVSLCKM
ncbi:MAG: ABC transporter substrate-binding protein [Fimbriimonadaceae bacterium]|nr:ABC transporter substrate-binding protein [Alphaproteobacteria bacterium]